MSAENIAIEEMLRFTLQEMTVQNTELADFWERWIEAGYYEAGEKGYDY